MLEINLHGSSQEIGLAHGESFKKQIAELVQIRRELLFKYLKMHSQEKVLDLCRQQIETLKKHPELFTEFKAIADSSDTTQEDLMILNNYTDLRDFIVLPEHEGKKDLGCTSFYLKNDHSTVCGQTWDMHASATPYVLKMNISEECSQSQKTVLSLVGCLGLAGVNQHGCFILINNMHCLETSKGLAWPALVRLILRQESALMAKNTLNNNLPSSGHNYVLGDASTGYMIETTGQQSDVICEINEQKQDFFFHTNHYLGRLKAFENMERQSQSTQKRYKVVEQWLKQSDKAELSFKECKKELFCGKTSETICYPPTGNDPHAAMTCGGIIIDLKNRHGEAFKGVYKDSRPQVFSF